MALKLAKKGNVIALNKGVKYAMIGLGWECGTQKVDLDASAFLLGADGKCPSEDDIIFYNMEAQDKTHYSGSVRYGGDSLTGSNGSTDDENIFIDFDKIPDHITTIDIAVTIYKWKKRHQTFGLVKKAYCRVVSTDSNFRPDGNEELRFELKDDSPRATAMLMAQLIKTGNTWSFKAVGQEYVNAGLATLIRDRGLECDNGDD